MSNKINIENYITTLQGYKCSDGKDFTNYNEALAHQAFILLAADLYTEDCTYNANIEAILKLILNKYSYQMLELIKYYLEAKVGEINND